MDTNTRQMLINQGISPDLTQHILEITNHGRKNPEPIRVTAMPDISDNRIIDLSSSTVTTVIKADRLRAALIELGLSAAKIEPLLTACGITTSHRGEKSESILTYQHLSALGTYLLPLVSFGVLNGGSASSYFDAKKNQEFSPFLYEHFAGIIESHAAIWAHQPKGLSPAFLSQTKPQSPNYSFLELKIRAWLLLLQRYQNAAAKLDFHLPWHGLERELPFFQMVSSATQTRISDGFTQAAESALVGPLAKATGINIRNPLTGTQDLIAAFTLPNSDGSRDIFSNARGIPGQALGLPGGHGQNFHVLSNIYQQMQSGGKRFAYLGNIDNLGFIPDPVAIALTTLEDCEASFEFAFKTPLDRKGGILVLTTGNRLTCGDIGQAVSLDYVTSAEAGHKLILFNCATGLFKLEALCPQIEFIANNLPVRFSNQDKDTGRYSQAEQTTWEVIGLLEKPLIIGVAKQNRFLAAKLFMDCILTSGLGQTLQPKSLSDQELIEFGAFLNRGLNQLLTTNYGLVNTKKGWTTRE